MNFLSHYYFDKSNPDEHVVLGSVLPDLIRNGQQKLKLHPQKNELAFIGDKASTAILTGWKRHLAVDKLFHSSTFFETETATLKSLLLPILTSSPVRPSFLAHIGVELILDHLLVTHHSINVDAFYQQLDKVKETTLNLFLQKSGAADATAFFTFFKKFKSSRYLFSYQQTDNISYALQRICMRVWANPFTDHNMIQLNEQLENYKHTVEKDYLSIFHEITEKLNP